MRGILSKLKAISWGFNVFILFVMFVFVSLFHITPVIASGSAIDTLAKQTDKQLRNVERKIYSGKTQEAMEDLLQAGAAIEKIEAKEPSNPKLRSLKSKYVRTKKIVDRKIAQAGQATASKSRSVVKATATDASAKLPSGVGKRLRDISKALNDCERYLGRQKIKDSRNKLSKAGELFAEIDKKYGGKFSTDHPDYKAVADRYLAIEKTVNQGADDKAKGEADAAQAVAVAKAKVEEWVMKFSPYIKGSYFPAGHSPSKQLLFPGTSNPEKFAEMNQVYSELKKLYADFLLAGFGSESPWPMDLAANDVKNALVNYENSMKSGLNGLMQAAESNVDQAITYLNKNTKWKNDAKALPSLVDKDWMSRIDLMVGQVEKGFETGSPAVASLQSKYKQLILKDQQHRKMRAERRRLRPEIYKGSDLNAIRGQAEAIIAKERGGSKILRVSIYENGWKEESVTEYTDTTQTAVRHRITQMINGQVAAEKDGKVEIHTVFIAKDKQSSGWSKLYGHIMYSDPMLAGNVNK